jgi:hypothetical protein
VSGDEEIKGFEETSANAWFEARQVALDLRDLLQAAGLARYFPFLQADVNVFGNGFVNIGRTTPAAAQRLAELLQAAREAMGEAAFAGQERKEDR